MPTRNSVLTATRKDSAGNTFTYYPVDNDHVWVRSPRVNNVLVLKDNPLSTFKSRVGNVHLRGPFGYGMMGNAGRNVSEGTYGITDSSFAHLSNRNYASLRKKLYDGNAALGVTFGSYAQSRDMIIDRYKTLTLRADHWAKTLGSQPRGKQVAGFHLEVIFGWTPLLADIHAATTSVIQKAIPLAHVKAKASAVQQINRLRPGFIQNRMVGSALLRESYAASVRIDNPNLWLAERAGLLNPVSVLWDLVPWSFVVNMFVNTGALVNSLTDYSGLTFVSFSRTRKSILDCEVTAIHLGEIQGTCRHFRSTKTRVLLGGPPRPNLQFMLPNLSAGTVAMAASLFTQKFSTIAKFVNPNRVLRT